MYSFCDDKSNCLDIILDKSSCKHTSPSLVRSASLPCFSVCIRPTPVRTTSISLTATSDTDMLTLVQNNCDHVRSTQAFRGLRGIDRHVSCTVSLPLLALSRHIVRPSPTQVHEYREQLSHMGSVGKSQGSPAREALLQALHNSGEETGLCEVVAGVHEEQCMPGCGR